MKKKQESPWQILAVLSSVGMQFIILVVGGVWIGRKFDGLMSSHPIGLLFGALLGLACGFVSAVYTFRTFMKEDK